MPPRFDMRRTTTLLVCLLTSLHPVAVHALFDLFNDKEEIRNEDGTVKWIEQKASIPPYPSPENLAPFPVATASRGITYSVDLNSVSVGQDRVVRYTSVVASKGGAKTVRHEAINCKRREFKTYAYGLRKGKFKRREKAWKRMTERGSMAYRIELADHYFCDDYGLPYRTREITRRLKAADGIGFDDNY